MNGALEVMIDDDDVRGLIAVALSAAEFIRAP
jgi:hypothetical protein